MAAKMQLQAAYFHSDVRLRAHLPGKITPKHIPAEPLDKLDRTNSKNSLKQSLGPSGLHLGIKMAAPGRIEIREEAFDARIHSNEAIVNRLTVYRFQRSSLL